MDSDEAVAKIECLAEQVRDYWGIDSGPIDNLQYLLESNGIVLTGFKDEESSIDAHSLQVTINERKMYIVALAIGKKPIERLRFDMAHELGHILMHRWMVETDEMTKEEFNALEKQANIFASAFLLPRKIFTLIVSAYPTTLGYYLELKKKWKVSMQAMIYRSRQLGIISGNQFQYIMRQISKNGWRLREPGDKPGKLEANIFQVAIDLLINGGYMSKDEILAEFEKEGVYLTRRDLENLMCLEEGTLALNTEVIEFPSLVKPK